MVKPDSLAMLDMGKAVLLATPLILFGAAMACVTPLTRQKPVNSAAIRFNLLPYFVLRLVRRIFVKSFIIADSDMVIGVYKFTFFFNKVLNISFFSEAFQKKTAVRFWPHRCYKEFVWF
jgi:hypothetical protein